MRDEKLYGYSGSKKIIRDTFEKALARSRKMLTEKGAAQFCPVCGSQMIQGLGAVFCEAGEWDGNAYEIEGDADVWECRECGEKFATGVPR